jgi:hypothetical protein
MSFRITYHLIVLLVCGLTPLLLKAQNSDAPKQLSNTYMLRNCHVVKQPGTIMRHQNVLIKDGWIADVGPNLKAPFDAQVIAADSMYVYAGFIDGHSYTGIAKVEQKDKPKVENPGFPSNTIAGVTPQISSIDTYKSTDKSVGDMRSAGFTISQVVPRGLMLPGSSNIILLGNGDADKMLLKANSAQNFQFTSASGVFPSTTIGVMAKLRDIYKNANIAGSHIEKFKTNPSGLARPDYDAELMAMYPVTTRKQVMTAVAHHTKDVHKSLALKDELGFDLALADVKQGWHYVDQIKSKNIGIWLSLDLPEDEKVEKKDTTSAKAPQKDSLDATKIIEKPKDIRQEAFDAKKLESYKQYIGQAALFEKKEIPFGFSMLNAKTTDFKKNIARMVKEGLSETYALSALTTHPAQLLGISTIVGTVEKGKMANLVITDKSFFEEKSSIRYVFVDGQKFEYNDKPVKAETKSNQKDVEIPNLAGKWSFSIPMEGEVETGKFLITKNGDEYKLVATSDSDPEELIAKEIDVKGNSMTFYFMIEMDQMVKSEFEIKFDGKSFKGTMDIPGMGSVPVTGDFIGPNKL